MPRIISAETCLGCRTCEIACSYHHKKVFSPKIASIDIVRQESEGKVRIVIYRQAIDGHMACDCAKGEEFCLQYCPERARNELKSILDSKTGDSSIEKE